MPAAHTFKPGDTVRAWAPFCAYVDGSFAVVTTDLRFRGDDPAVKAYPGRFVSLSASTAEALDVRHQFEDEAAERQRRLAERDRQADLSRLQRLREATEARLAPKRAEARQRAAEIAEDSESRREAHKRRRTVDQQRRDLADAERKAAGL